MRQAFVIATTLVLLATGAAASPSSYARKPIWKPRLYAAIAYASQRRGAIAFAVRTRTRSWGWRRAISFRSASVVKAMLLVAYLNEPWVRGRRLRPDERALLSPMILWSDNDAATRVFSIVGTSGLRLVAYRSNMRHFTPVDGAWSVTGITAADQVRFFIRVDRLVPARHRAYAMRLLASVVPSQRWGVALVRPRGWKLYFKGGWTEDPSWIDHQVALLRRGRQAVSIAILTEDSGSHEYGRATLRGIASRLVSGLARAKAVP